MAIYRIHGVAFESSLELPELDRAADPAAFRVFEARLPRPGDDWVDPWQRDPGGPWIRIQSGQGYRIRYQDQVDFLVSPDGASIAVDVLDCAPATVRHFLLDQVIPLALSTRALVLHASAVAIDDHLVAFTGPCGSGKSTLAALLAAAGHPIAADDAMLIHRHGTHLAGVPSYPGVRLWPDMARACAPGSKTLPVSAHSGKRRVRETLPFDGRRRMIAAIYVLGGSAPGVTFRPLAVRQIAMAFIEQGLRLEQRAPATLTREMERACDAASCARAWALEFPRDLGRRTEVVDAVVAHARGLVGTPCCS